jgi:uncharacterized protein with PIN domain
MNVSFRFYARLNDFLPFARRGRRFGHVLRNVSSVKDAIEALGVPHPEVDVILINGAAADFSVQLRDGDDVSVYPAFRSLDVSGVRRAGADPPPAPGFAVDAHLGKLASLLRLAGFDAVIVDDDAALANTAAREDRVVLTRDVALLKRSIIRYGYWVRNTDPERQLAEVLERFDLMERMEPFARCLRCNTRLEEVEAAAVADRLLPCTRAEFHDFRRCPGCNRIYWPGSHYDALRAVLERAKAFVINDS